jgi:hypothetical protein
MPLNDVVRAMLERPVAFQPILARICESATAGLMLSQAVYWSERAKLPDGWFYKTMKEWQQEICLSRHEQDGARRKLKALGFWQEKAMGVPCTVHYRVDFEALAVCISQYAEKRQTGLPKSGKLDCRKAADKLAENRQTSLPETGKHISETTQETTRDYNREGRAQTRQAFRPAAGGHKKRGNKIGIGGDFSDGARRGTDGIMRL